MKDLKGALLYAFLGIEFGMFVFFYTFGAHGIRALQYLDKENAALEEKNAQLRQDIQELERECALWVSCPFYKEKVARERLQMACKDETVYYIS